MKRLYIFLIAILSAHISLTSVSAEDVLKEDLAHRYGRIVEEQKEYNRTHFIGGIDFTALHEDMEMQTTQALLPLLSHPQWEVRQSAAYVIRLRPSAELERDDVRQAVTKTLNLEREDYVISDLVYLVVRSHATAAIPSLTQALLSARHNEELRREIAHSLGVFGDTSAVPALIKATAAKSRGISEASLWALVTIGDYRALPTVRKFAHNQRRPDRSNAIIGLGIMKDVKSISYLRELLKSPDNSTLIASIRALGYIHAKLAIPDLSLLLNHPNGEVSAKAFEAILDIGGTEALRVFLERYKAMPNDGYALRGIPYFDEVWKKFPQVQEKLTPKDFNTLSVALNLVLPQGSSTPVDRIIKADYIKKVWAMDKWYFVWTNYGDTGHTFVVRREGNEWVMARVIGKWIS